MSKFFRVSGGILLGSIMLLWHAGMAAMAQDAGKNSSGAATVRSGFVEVDGGKLFYDMAGQGQTMVLLHDGLLHRETWNGQFPVFAEKYRVVRYDRRGYGKSSLPDAPFSDLDDLHRLFTELGLQKAILIGCSAGSRLAMDFTIAYPELVSTLILTGAVVGGYPFTDHFYTRGGRTTFELYQNQDAFRNFWLTDDPYTIYAEHPEARARAAALLNANPQNMNLGYDRFRQGPERPAVNALNEIAVPALIMVGEYDIPDVHAHCGVIDAGIPDSRRIIINNAAHLAHFEKPDEFNKLVLDFLKETEFWAVSRAQGLDAAIEMLKEPGDFNSESFPFTEGRVNQLGYQYLQSGNITDALKMFRLNVLVFPNSANTYDSYGEALLAKGDTTGAIQNYTKSVELNPNNANAVAVLKQLGVK